MLPAVRRTGLMVGKTYVGIDFGTSTTVVSVAGYDCQGGMIHAESLRLAQLLPDGALYSSEIVPTVIAWHQGKIMVGEGASRMKYVLRRGKNIWYSFKMELGEDLGTKYYDSELRDVEPFLIRNPVDAARVFFSYVKFLILKYCDDNGLSKDISYSVSIPASFEANQRKDLMDALLANDMNVSKQALIDEPNAAFISYAVSRASEGRPMFISPDYNPKVFVFDFGGGTCDISVLEVGQDAGGFFSKNIAISKFTKLGGDDIDRYIACNCLLPRFLDANGKSREQFRTAELKSMVQALTKIAERLKVMINKSLAVQVTDYALPATKSSDFKTEIESCVRLETSKGELSQDKFYLTNKEMTEAMGVFTKAGVGKTTRLKGQEDYNSIFTPVESALEKAKLAREEIDYVLLIGGSAQSPYIQEALHAYFCGSDMLVPVNLQTHVSQGAAIHSLVLNGMGKCLIQPITSEPILVVTRDESPRVILPAGTLIPCDTVIVDDLVTGRDGQSVVELPICVGNKTKMLFDLKVESPLPGGFPAGTPISLAIEMNADKMLMVHATCMGVVCHVDPLNPFANKELTTEERLALQAERRANIEAARNGGVPSKETLVALRKAYEDIGKDLKAAETYELQAELYPGSVNYNNIGLLYRSSGNYFKAVEFYEKALADNPHNATIHLNFGLAMKGIDSETYTEHIAEALRIDPDDYAALVESGRIDIQAGRTEEGERKKRKAYGIMLKQWQSGSLDKTGCSWLRSCARELGETQVARQVGMSMESAGHEDYYDTENLSKVKPGIKHAP